MTKVMYQGRRNFSSGNRFQSGGFNKPRFGGQRFSAKGGSASGWNRPQRAGRRSQLEGKDINMFIKKVEEVSSADEFVPHNSFSDFDLTNPMKQSIINRGYTTPTPVQDQAIEPIIQGRDLIGLADTGTGKTAAFLIPIIDKIFKNHQDKALIIAPTRELAVQINEEFRIFAKDLRLYSALIIGGSNFSRQIQDIRRNPDVVVATPGRLKDLIERRIIQLNDFSIFVLDEVDMMVDIGFIQDIKYFVSLLPKIRQSLFFSATISPKVQDILRNFVSNPVTVSVKQQDTSENVEQNVIKVINREKKVDQLHDLLIQDGFDKVLIFGRTKHGIERLNKELEFRGFKVGAIHGNKNQNQRQRILQSFKQDQIRILLATDVASRGLDIDSVTHVINYDLPENYDDYIHRIGRTGRAGKKGIALTFVD